MALIRMEDVRVAYTTGSRTRTVLAGLSLAIEAGEFVCLLGETGCGKSTMLRLILGAEQPVSGTVEVAGERVRGLCPKRGYVPQRYGLFPDRTALANVAFGPEMYELSVAERLLPKFRGRRREIRRQALELLAELGLDSHDANKYPHQLSGGMQQRVAIAQALIMNPAVLLMDEAFSALDPSTRASMQALIRRVWRERGATILFITHNTQEAVMMGTRAIVLAREGDESGSKIALDMELPGATDPEWHARDARETREMAEHIAGFYGGAKASSFTLRPALAAS